MIGTMLKASLFILLLCASTWAIADQHDDIIWGINVSPLFGKVNTKKRVFAIP